jgi:hypothetical protein
MGPIDLLPFRRAVPISYGNLSRFLLYILDNPKDAL